MNGIINFTTRMPMQLRDKMKIISKNKGYPLNTLILQILWDFIEKEESR